MTSTDRELLAALLKDNAVILATLSLIVKVLPGNPELCETGSDKLMEISRKNFRLAALYEQQIPTLRNDSSL